MRSHEARPVIRKTMEEAAAVARHEGVTLTENDNVFYIDIG